MAHIILESLVGHRNSNGASRAVSGGERTHDSAAFADNGDYRVSVCLQSFTLLFLRLPNILRDKVLVRTEVHAEVFNAVIGRVVE